MNEHTIKVRLVMDMRDARPSHLEGLVFGELVKLAAPVVKQYHGDLFYDALWLDKHKPDSFYYAVRESGTAIGHVDDEVFDLFAKYNDQVYHVGVIRDEKDTWWAVIRKVA